MQTFRIPATVYLSTCVSVISVITLSLLHRIGFVTYFWLIKHNNTYRRAQQYFSAMLRRAHIYVQSHYKAELVAGVFFVSVIILPVSVFALSMADLFGMPAHADNPITSQDRMATMAVLTPSQTFIAKNHAYATTEIETTNSDDALVPVIGPSGTSADVIEEDTAGTISIHIVQPGETLEQIAKLYNIEARTIRLANNIPLKGTITTGQDLLIMPVDSLQYKVQKGDTLESIAKKFGGKGISEIDLTAAISDITLYNDIETNADLIAGKEIIIPGADHEAHAIGTPVKSSVKTSSKDPGAYKGGKGYFKRMWGGVQTQGFHDKYRAKDYGMPIGSKVGASADGIVIATITGWGGGYGNYIIISHPEVGAQTLYAHLSQINVTKGQRVSQGETIGLSGNTGRSTGPHLHFEIRNYHNDIPF